MPQSDPAQSDSHRWVLPRLLTRAAVEGWLAAVPPTTGEVTFHLGQDGCRSGLGGAESLQAAICVLRRRGVQTKVSFPASTFSHARRLNLFDIAHEDEGGTPAERTLAYRLPGLILAQLCEPADDSGVLHRVRVRQAAAISRDRYIFGHGTARAIAVIGADDHRTHLRDSELVRQSKLETQVLRMLGTRNYHPGRGARLMDELLEFIYQATENTFDHGRRTLEGEPIRQVRMASISRHTVGIGAGAVPLEQHFPDPTSALRAYVERAQRRIAAHGGDPERMQLWSVIVSDGGVGIAARMNGGLDIYSADLGYEYKLVQEAVLPEGTTKPLGQPGRGRGLVKMMRATYRLGGFFEIRTGRLALRRTYLNEDGSDEPGLDFRNRHSSAFDVHGEGEAHVPVAGTVVSLIFPAFDLGPNDRPGRSHD